MLIQPLPATPQILHKQLHLESLLASTYENILS